MIKTSQNLVKSSSILFRVTTHSSLKKVNYSQPFSLFSFRRQLTTTTATTTSASSDTNTLLPTTQTTPTVNTSHAYPKRGERTLILRRTVPDLKIHAEIEAATRLVSARIHASGSSANVSPEEFKLIMSALDYVSRRSLLIEFIFKWLKFEHCEPEVVRTCFKCLGRHFSSDESINLFNLILDSYPHLLREDIIVDFMRSLRTEAHAALQGAETYWVLASSLPRLATQPTVFHGALSLLSIAYEKDQEKMVEKLFKMKDYLKEKTDKIPIHIYVHMLMMLKEYEHHEELDRLHQETIECYPSLNLNIEGLMIDSWRVRRLFTKCFNRYAQLLKRHGRIDDIDFLGKMIVACFHGKNWELGMQLLEEIDGRYENSLPVAINSVRFLKKLKNTFQSSSDVSSSTTRKSDHDELMIEKRKNWEKIVPAKLDEVIMFLLTQILVTGTLVTPKVFAEVIDEVVELGGLYRLIRYLIGHNDVLAGFVPTETFIPILHNWAANGQWQNCWLFWEIHHSCRKFLTERGKVAALGSIMFSLIKSNEIERVRWLLKEKYVVDLLGHRKAMPVFMQSYDSLAKRHPNAEFDDIHKLLAEAGFQKKTRAKSELGKKADSNTTK